jgi:hypothetical protein
VALAAKLKTKKAEKGELVTKLNELQEKLTHRNGEVEKISESLNGASQEFHALVEGHAQAEALTKIFEKLVKRKALKYVKKKGEERIREEVKEILRVLNKNI